MKKFSIPIGIITAACMLAVAIPSAMAGWGDENATVSGTMTAPTGAFDKLVMENDEAVGNATDGEVSVTFNDATSVWGTVTYDSSRVYTDVADDDSFLIDVEVKNDSNEIFRLARWSYIASDITSNTEDGKITCAIPIDGTYTTVLQLDANGLTAAQGIVATINTNAIVVTDSGTFGGAVTAVTVVATTSMTAPDIDVTDDLSVTDDATINGFIVTPPDVQAIVTSNAEISVSSSYMQISSSILATCTVANATYAGQWLLIENTAATNVTIADNGTSMDLGADAVLSVDQTLTLIANGVGAAWRKVSQSLDQP